jgi:ElaB/YqjD/DUF883 family membrane-anchored ribosome-binding protein
MKTTDRLVGDLKNVVQDAQDILRDKAESANETAGAARERLLSAIETAKACCENLEDKAVAGAKASDKAVRDHPYQAAGIALGVGLLAGYVISRRYAD